MSDVELIKQRARERAIASGLPYTGAVTPVEAHTLMRNGVKLVDVRTQAELYWVGHIPGSVYVEWNSFPGGTPNHHFIAQLAELTRKDEPVMFLCRSGGRSHFAAMLATQSGWRECSNVLEGFEGDKDANGHRSAVSGWKKAGLPWTQS